jgi:predicted DNA-binding transcriptional regulator AlpA
VADLWLFYNTGTCVMTTPPTLDKLAADPAQATALSLEVATVLLARVCVVQAALTTRAVALALAPAAPNTGDTLLDVAAAATKLGVSKSYLYRHASTLPFTVRVGRGLRFSVAGIERHIRERQAR